MTLDPVRLALLADAHRDAEALLAAAERDAEAAMTAARLEAERLLAAARADGTAEARAVAVAEGARARRRAREVVQAARRDAYEQVRAEARRTASELVDAPGYAALVDGVARVARRQLGEDALVTVDDEVGGLVARAGSRSVDYRLPVMADRCLAALGAEVEILWR